MSRKDLLRAGPPCPRECANWEPLRDTAVWAALGHSAWAALGCGARGLPRAGMAWAAPGGGGAGAAPGGDGEGCSGWRRRGRSGSGWRGLHWVAAGKGAGRTSAFYPGARIFKSIHPVLRAAFFALGLSFFKKTSTAAGVFYPGTHVSQKSRRALPRPAPGRKRRAKSQPPFCGGASRTDRCHWARPRQAAGSFGTRPIKNRGGSKSKKFTPAPGACLLLQTDLRCARQPSARYLMSMPPKTQLALR